MTGCLSKNILIVMDDWLILEDEDVRFGEVGYEYMARNAKVSPPHFRHAPSSTNLIRGAKRDLWFKNTKRVMASEDMHKISRILFL